MRRFTPVFLLLLLFIAVAVPCAAASPPLVLQSASSFYPLSGHVDILEDKQGTLTIDQVSAPGMVSRFRSDKGDVPSFGMSKSVYWLRFTISPGTAVEHLWLLELAAPHLYYIDLYAPRPEGGFERMQAGSMRPMRVRVFPHINPVFPLDVNGAARTFYLRADAHIFAYFPLTLQTTEAFAELNHQRDIFSGCFFGGILVICLYHFFLYLSLRDKTYLYYVFEIFCVMLFELATKGFLLETVAAAHPELNRYTYLTGVFASFAGLLFARNFLATIRNAPVIDFMLRLFMPITLMVIPLALMVSPATGRGVLAVVAVCNTVIALAGGVVIFRRGYHPAGYYLAARIFRIIGLWIYAAAVFKLLPWNFETLYGIQIGTVLEVGLLAFALADRINVMRQDKEIAEAAALTAARESEQKAIELAEEMTIELREALAGEQRALERQNRFLAMLSHEYRTPLAIVRANLDLMELQEPETGDNRGPRLATMKHAVGRLVELMEISLQKERLNGFRSAVALEQLELVSFLDSIVDSAEGLWPERTFVFQPDISTAMIMAESATLKTALFNLLDNACKYSPPDQPVEIECRIDGNVIVVVIRDRGKGILPGEGQKIFEKYYRGSGSSDTSGSGVGLWLVRQIIQQLGGSIVLEGAAKGGTAAVVRLPLV